MSDSLIALAELCTFQLDVNRHWRCRPAQTPMEYLAGMQNSRDKFAPMFDKLAAQLKQPSIVPSLVIAGTFTSNTLYELHVDQKNAPRLWIAGGTLEEVVAAARVQLEGGEPPYMKLQDLLNTPKV
jgi:hypothetical protein